MYSRLPNVFWYIGVIV